MGVRGTKGTGRIADPVHRYVEFTWLEQRILAHRLAQRLRNISQNGLAHYVFPEARTSRFSHSLGAMHLSSKFLVACLSQSDSENQNKLLAAMREAIEMAAGDVSDVEKAVKKLGKTRGTASMVGFECPSKYRPAVMIAEQGLRLAALFHDLGHLPFSHDFEAGLTAYWEGLDPESKTSSPLDSLFRRLRHQIHEHLGHGLAISLFKDVFANLTGPEGEFARLSFQFAYNILRAGDPRPTDAADSVVRWLHTLIDGDLDVDRCDFILRDARNYGFEFASYDLPRLLDNLAVSWENEMFSLVVNEKGQSALESYLIARFRAYQYGVRHHKVAQIGAALRHSVAHTLEILSEEADIKKFLGDISRLATIVPDKIDDGPKVIGRSVTPLLLRFAEYDDIWWITLMRKALRKTRKRHEREWLGLVLWRQQGPRSLWKRAENLRQLIDTELPAWNDSLPKFDDPDELSHWTRVDKQLSQRGVLVIRHKFVPWKSDHFREEGHSALRVQLSNGATKPLSKISPLVSALPEAWLQDIHVHASTTSSNEISAGEVIELLPRFTR